MVEGLEGGRWAIVFKVHHCMVDGIAGVALLRRVAGCGEHHQGREAGLGEPQPEPGAVLKVLDAWGGLPPAFCRPPRSFPEL